MKKNNNKVSRLGLITWSLNVLILSSTASLCFGYSAQPPKFKLDNPSAMEIEEKAYLGKIQALKTEAEKDYESGNYLSVRTKREQILKLHTQNGSEKVNIADANYSLATILVELGYLKEAQKYFTAAQSYLEKELYPTDPYFLDNLSVYGNVLFHLEEFDKSNATYLQAIDHAKTNFGESNIKMFTPVSNISSVQLVLGDKKGSENSSLQALKIVENVKGKGHYDSAVVLHNLAHFYHEDKQYDKAESYYKQSIAIKEKKYGTDHPNVAFGYHNLASVYIDQQRYDENIKLMNKAILIREKSLGKQSPTLASAYGNLALSHSHLNHKTLALKHGKHSLEIYRLIFQNDKSKLNAIELAGAAQRLATIEYQYTNLNAAEILYKEAIELLSKYADKDDLILAENYQSLGHVHRYQKQHAAALNDYQNAHSIYESKNIKNLSLAMVLKDMAEMQASLNKADDAIESYRSALSLYTKLDTASDTALSSSKDTALSVNKDIANCHFGLAIQLVSKGYNKNSVDHYKKAISFYENNPDLSYHFENLNTLYLNLASVYALLNQAQNAYDTYLYSLKHLQAQKNGKTRHAKEIAQLHFQLAYSAEQSNHKELAQTHYQHSIDLQESLKSTDSDYYYNALYNLASLQQNQNKLKEVVITWEKALNFALSADKNMESDVELISSTLGYSYASLDQLDQSLKHYNRALAIHKKHANWAEVERISGNLAIMYSNKEDYKSVALYYRQALDASQKNNTSSEATSANDIAGSNYMMGLAYALLKLEDFKQSKHWYEKVVGLYEAKYPKGHEKIDIAKNNLSFLDFELAKEDESK